MNMSVSPDPLLQSMLELQKVMLDSTHDALFVFDEDMRIILANAPAARLIGVSQEELLKLGLDDLIPPHLRAGHREKARRHLTESISAREMSNWRAVQCRRANGESVNVQIKLNRHCKAGRCVTIACLKDMSEAAQAELGFHHKELEAHQARQVKDRFVHNVRADLDGPLKRIGGLASRAKLIANLPGVDDRLDEIVRLAFRTHLEIEKTLLYSGADIADVSRFGKEATESFSRLVNNLEQMFRTYEGGKGKGVQLIWEFDDRLERCEVRNPSAVHHIVFNVVENAAKYAPKGKILVKFELVSESGGSTEVRFLCADDGPGMPEAISRSILDPMAVRAMAARGEVIGKGTGLQLAKRYAEQLGGGLQLRSVEGQGTQVRAAFHLPLKGA